MKKRTQKLHLQRETLLNLGISETSKGMASPELQKIQGGDGLGDWILRILKLHTQGCPPVPPVSTPENCITCPPCLPFPK